LSHSDGTVTVKPTKRMSWSGLKSLILWGYTIIIWLISSLGGPVQFICCGISQFLAEWDDLTKCVTGWNFRQVIKSGRSQLQFRNMPKTEKSIPAMSDYRLMVSWTCTPLHDSARQCTLACTGVALACSAVALACSAVHWRALPCQRHFENLANAIVGPGVEALLCVRLSVIRVQHATPLSTGARRILFANLSFLHTLSIVTPTF
jgi:hypothetical protein